MTVDIYSALAVTVRFLAFTIPVVVIASAATSVMIRRGLMNRLALLASPILERLHVGHVVATSAAVCFISATASYSMLAQALKDRVIDEREVIAASFINSFPSSVSHTYRFFIPFVIPILGWTGVVYTALRMLVAVTKSVIGVAMAAKWSTNSRMAQAVKSHTPHTSFTLVKRTGVMMFITYFSVQIATQLGVFDIASSFFSFLPVEPSIIAIATIELVSTKAAIVTGSGMLESGGISVKWLLVALMLGNVITLSTGYVKHSLPFHVSLFGRLGVKIVALNAIVSLVLDAMVIAGVILLL